jgi:hypothetical protein
VMKLDNVARALRRIAMSKFGLRFRVLRPLSSIIHVYMMYIVNSFRRILQRSNKMLNQQYNSVSAYLDNASPLRAADRGSAAWKANAEDNVMLAATAAKRIDNLDIFLTVKLAATPADQRLANGRGINTIPLLTA